MPNKTVDFHSSFTIRKVTEADFNKIRQLFKIYERGLGIDLCFQDFENEINLLPGVYAEPKGTILKAVVDDQIVGCVALKPLDNETCEMKRLFVLDAFKGRSIGKALAIKIIDEARDKSYKIMKLDTLDRLRPAVKLYQTLGFELTEPYNFNPEEDILYFQFHL